MAGSDFGAATLAAGTDPPSEGISSGQVAVAFAYVVFFGLWGYAELLERSRKKLYARLHNDDSKEPSLPETLATSGLKESEEYTFLNSGFVKCLRLDKQALLEHRHALRSTVEFGTIMLWYYLADRTTVFPQGIKSYSRDVLAFIFLALTLVALATSRVAAKTPTLLNRQQTEEWKGWMQVLFLLYHYYEAKEVYNAIRVFIAGYVWMTGYGNFSYYYKTGNFSLGRFCQMMWRLNFLVTLTCIVLQNSYMLYYICPMHTLFTVLVYAVLAMGSRFNSSTVGILIKFALSLAFVFIFWDIKPVFYAVWKPFTFLMGYSDPRRPTDDKLHEWHFRSSLDRYVWIHGMMCAYCHPWADSLLQRIDKMEKHTRYVIRLALSAATISVLVLWFQHVYILPKTEYNALHPYTSWIPITCWIVLRNVTPGLRTFSLGLYGWLGCITLETYVGQFHTWLSTGIPDGQPKMLLTFFPAEYPLLNFAGTTAVYVFVSYRLFILTNALKDVVVPSKAGREMIRNFMTLGISVLALYTIGGMTTHFGGLNGVL